MDSGKYSPWAEESVVKRVEMRLWNADENLGSARHTYMRMRMQWVRLRSYHQLRRSWHASGHVDSVLEQFCDRAFQRVLDPLPEPSFTSSMSMWPGYPQDIWDFNQRNYGLALTWGMTHVDSLRPRDIYESKRARLRQVQAAATAQEWEPLAIRPVGNCGPPSSTWDDRPISPNSIPTFPPITIFLQYAAIRCDIEQ